MQAGQRVSVIDLADPASQASGRNGGNFELIPENFLGPYEGLVRERYKLLRVTRPGLPEEALREQAERQARLVLGFGLRNSERFRRFVIEERIDCEFRRLDGYWFAAKPEDT